MGGKKCLDPDEDNAKVEPNENVGPCYSRKYKEINNNVPGTEGESTIVRKGRAVKRIRWDEPTQYMLVRRNHDSLAKNGEKDDATAADNDADDNDTDMTLNMIKKESPKFPVCDAKQRKSSSFSHKSMKEENRETSAPTSSVVKDICYVSRKRKYKVDELGCDSELERSNLVNCPVGQGKSRISNDAGGKMLELKNKVVRRIQGSGGVLIRVLHNSEGLRSKEEENSGLLAQPPSFSNRKSICGKQEQCSETYTGEMDKERVFKSLKNRHFPVKSGIDVLSRTNKSVKKAVKPSIENVSSGKQKNAKSTLKSTALVQLSSPSGKTSRSTEKRMLRDRIKEIILNAGWKIELKPRKNRNYEDSIYVSPQGSGYWSITKAYAVFLEQNKEGNYDNSLMDSNLSMDSHRNSSNINGSDSVPLAPVIPDHLLSILKRNVVNKRGKRKVVADENVEDECEPSSHKNMSKDDAHVKSRKNVNKNASVDLMPPSCFESDLSKERKKGGRGCKLMVRQSHEGTSSADDDYVIYDGRMTLLAWMINVGIVSENETVSYRNRKNTHPLLKGHITRDGIHCHCCDEIVSVSDFEIHSGSKEQRSYENIYFDEIRSSMFECLVEAWENQDEADRSGFSYVNIKGDDPDDDTCGICGDGGDLICCDGCPSTYHSCCLNIEMLPPGDWLCSNCSCRFCGMVDNSTSSDNSHSRTLLFCIQCERKYHECCVPEADSISSNNFCGENCKEIFEQLQKLLGVKNMLKDGLSWSVVKRVDADMLTAPLKPVQRAECNAKAAVALSVMNECFLPIIDQRSGINMIHNAIYNFGSNFNRLNFRGFYTFFLEKEDEMISAASVRIHGTVFAEMPFIGTRSNYRRKGMCHHLLNSIEMALSSLGIRKLVIPAISELLDTWTTVFDFKPLGDRLKHELKSWNVIVFPGTGLLEKSLINHGNCQSTIQDWLMSESESDTHQQPLMQNQSEESESSDHEVLESISHHKQFVTQEEAVSSKDLHDSDGSISSTSEVNANSSDVPCSEHSLLENTVEKAHVADSILKKPEMEIDSHGSSISCQISLPTKCNTKIMDSSDESNEASLTMEKH